MLNSYLHPNHSPSDARRAAHADILAAVHRLREAATDLENFVRADVTGLEEHGDAWAQDESIKVNLTQYVVSANDDIARAQKSLFGACSMAARA